MKSTGKHASLGVALMTQIVTIIAGAALLIWGTREVVVRALRFLVGVGN